MSLYNELNYIDGITIIDKEGLILFTVKFNPDIDKKMEESIVGKNLFDVFYNINKSNSSLFECMDKDKLIERKGQYVKNLYVDDSITDNISIPIKHGGLIVGAIELSKVIADYDDNVNELPNDSAVMKLKPKCLNMGYNARYNLDNIICKDKNMVKLVEYAHHVAKSNSPIFITGETGTGKELFANGIHNASNRKDKPFIAQNCSAVPENLLESIFFGTSKGSYTGALDRKGLFEACDGGTLFLDELHCMPLHLQAKLLRAIEDKSARRIGENKERNFDVRIIAATNIKNEEILNKGFIRQDLYYRLSVVKIDIPPLRERLEDIKVLSYYFIKKYNSIFEKNITSISQEVTRFMLNYDWPGNIRELENFIESAILNVSKEKIIIDEKEAKEVNNIFNDDFLKTKSLKNILENTELNLIEEALMISKGNVTKAAEYLEIPRQTLQQKMIKYSTNLKPKS
ncbi:MAG: family ATPase [Bacillota bacterium]|jgi:arginine utilization regulatory protein|nr:family ATPase [Bacillota bacterium]